MKYSRLNARPWEIIREKNGIFWESARAIDVNEKMVSAVSGDSISESMARGVRREIMVVSGETAVSGRVSAFE